MATFQLQDFVLLESNFEFAPEVEGDEEEAGPPSEWPTEDLLKLDVSLTAEEPGYVLVMEGQLDDPRLGFALSFRIGAIFEQGDPDSPAPPDDEVRPTLTFMAFPYVRELVSSLTSRSPTGPYWMPPRALPPDPRSDSD